MLYVLDVEALHVYLAEVGYDDHVSSLLRGLSLFAQDLNSSDANRGNGGHNTACLMVGNRALTHCSTITSSYKYLLMLSTDLALAHTIGQSGLLVEHARPTSTRNARIGTRPVLMAALWDTCSRIRS
jgi:hypothetical protein